MSSQFIVPCVAEFALPRHADFPGIVPEIRKNTSAAHVDVIFQHGIADIRKMRHRYTMPDDRTFHLHRMTDDTVVTNGAGAAQVRIGPDTAMAPYAYKPFDDGAGLDDRALSQLQYTINNGRGMYAAVAGCLQVPQLLRRSLQSLPWGQAFHGSWGKRF